MDPHLVDSYIVVTDEQAIAATRALAETEGIFGGFSTGANLYAAGELLRSGKATSVAVTACDSGLKYISTDLWA